MLYNQRLKIMLIVVLVLIGLILSRGNTEEPQQPIPTPQATQIDTEKQQLTAQLHEAQRETQYYYTAYRSIKKDWEKYFAPSQVEYMKRRAK